MLTKDILLHIDSYIRYMLPPRQIRAHPHSELLSMTFPRAPPVRPASTRPPPLGTPCICSFGAGAGRCSPPRTPCICSFGAGAGRCSPPRTPCMCSFGAGAGRCLPPRTPCMCSFGAGADRHCAASCARRLPLCRPLRASAACLRHHRPPPALNSRLARLPMPLSRSLLRPFSCRTSCCRAVFSGG